MLLDKKIPVSYIFRKVRSALFWTLVISAVIYVLTFFFAKWLPEMPLTIPAFIGTAISVLLSFKLSQSYERWWEARKIWGSIVNDSRSLVMQITSLLSAEQETAIRRMAHRQIAWCYTLAAQLRGRNPLEIPEGLVSQEDHAAISTHSNKALALLNLHAADLAQLRASGKIDRFAQLQIDSTLVRLCDAMGRAERIKSTVFPVTYGRFLHFTIYLFVVTLGIALGNVKWYFEIPLLLMISSAFFLLEKSATHMQDPFSDRPTDTAMNAISRTIEINIRQLLREEQVPAPYPPHDFYLL